MENEARALGSPDFGTLLKRYRLAAGLSQEALAERARISVNGISALERGYRRVPQRETLALLAAALALDEYQRQAFEAAATRRVGHRGFVTVGPWQEGAMSRLPVALTSFVGREAELREIAPLIHQHRLVTITGPGGIGKTQTALRVAGASADSNKIPICFVGLAPVADSSLVTAAIAAELGVQGVPNRSVLRTLLSYLNDKVLLLVLDSCEHVVVEVATVSQALLASCSGVRILATSREPLAGAGERTYRLPSLNASDAIALFADRAQAVEAHFRLTDRNTSTVSEICRRLDSIPLAIELAAAHVDVLSLASLAENLNNRFRILVGGERTALPRQQTMRATIDWSYNLLSLREKRVFESLSVFSGGWTLPAATTVGSAENATSDDVLDVLSSLVRKSLVVLDLDANEPRYELLETFRQYAREKLEAHGGRQSAAHRHAKVCLEHAEWLNRAFDCEPVAILRERGNDDAANWRAALHWSLAERGDVILGQRLAGELSPLFLFFLSTARNHFFFGHGEGRRWIATALELVDEGTPASALAALNYAQAAVAGNLREYRIELESSQSALTRYRTLGDSLGMARAQATLSHALLYLGRPAEAKAVLEEALPLARKMGGRSRFSVACLLRLLALASQEDIVAARSYIAEALQIHDVLGHENSFAMALLDLSECEFCAGNPDLAFERAAESLAAAPPSNVFLKCTAIYGKSLFLAALTRYDEARLCAHEALDLASEYGFAAYVAFALEHLATMAGPQAETARLLGFAGARLAELGSARLPFLQPQRDRFLSELNDEMGSDAIDRLMAEGAAMTEDQAVEAVRPIAR